MPSAQAAESAAIRSRGVLLHRQLFTVLRDEIARGVYEATGALPKEEALCERFQVSRITVRRALGDLASLGIVERRHGLGTFVRPGRRPRRVAPTLGVIDALRRTATSTEVQVLEVEQAEPLPDVAALLRLAPGERALHALRLRSAGGAPVMLTEAWVPPALGRRVTAAALRKRALYEILMERGVEFGRVVQEITAQAATPDLARLLRTEVGSPLIRLARLMHDLRSQPVLHLTALLPPERSRVLMDVPGSKVNTFDAGRIVFEPVFGPHGPDD